MRRLESTDPRIQEALVLYKAGNSIKSLCDQFHLDGSVVRKFIIDAGLLRSRSEAIRSGKSDAKINDHILDTLTPEALYWIGFLYTDGHIEKEPRARITLTISDQDKLHLEKYIKFFGEGLEIRDVTNKDPQSNPAPGQINFDGKHLRVAFSSKLIYNRLMDLGFTHKKTLTLTPSSLLKKSKDFWRGCIDGDGWVCETGCKYNYTTVGLSGTEETIDGFLEFVRSNGIETETIPHKRKKSNVYQIDIHNIPAKKILHLLYKDSTLYLDRKYQKYLELCNTEISELIQQ